MVLQLLKVLTTLLTDLDLMEPHQDLMEPHLVLMVQDLTLDRLTATWIILMALIRLLLLTAIIWADQPMEPHRLMVSLQLMATTLDPLTAIMASLSLPSLIMAPVIICTALPTEIMMLDTVLEAIMVATMDTAEFLAAVTVLPHLPTLLMAVQLLRLTVRICITTECQMEFTEVQILIQMLALDTLETSIRLVMAIIWHTKFLVIYMIPIYCL